MQGVPDQLMEMAPAGLREPEARLCAVVAGELDEVQVFELLQSIRVLRQRRVLVHPNVEKHINGVRWRGVSQGDVAQDCVLESGRHFGVHRTDAAVGARPRCRLLPFGVKVSQPPITLEL